MYEFILYQPIGEKKVKHSKLSDQTEEALQNKKYVSGLDTSQLDMCYPPIIQVRTTTKSVIFFLLLFSFWDSEMCFICTRNFLFWSFLTQITENTLSFNCFLHLLIQESHIWLFQTHQNLHYTFWWAFIYSSLPIKEIFCPWESQCKKSFASDIFLLHIAVWWKLLVKVLCCIWQKSY